MNWFLVCILAVLLGRYLLEWVSDWLNLRHVSEVLPREFEGIYDGARYRESQTCLRETTAFGLIADMVDVLVVVALIVRGVFNWVDGLAGFSSLDSCMRPSPCCSRSHRRPSLNARLSAIGCVLCHSQGLILLLRFDDIKDEGRAFDRLREARPAKP